MIEMFEEPTPEFAYFTFSGTGCTCCNNEDRVFGPYSSLERAREERDLNARTKAWASQYAKNGNHSIGRIKIESTLSDGRILFEDRVMRWADETFDAEIGHPNSFTPMYSDEFEFIPGE